MKDTVMNILRNLCVKRPSSAARSRAGAMSGFTAVELMVVIVIVAILAAFAAPSFDGLIKRWRVLDARGAMTSALYLARSEAIKRGGNVVLQKTLADATNCTLPLVTANWGCGWVVYFDANNSGAMDAGEQIQSYPAPKGLTVNLGGSGPSRVVFDRWGVANTGGLDVAIFPLSGGAASPAASTLCLGNGGRVRYLNAGTC